MVFMEAWPVNAIATGIFAQHSTRPAQWAQAQFAFRAQRRIDQTDGAEADIIMGIGQ